jgi:hypothetical protein
MSPELLFKYEELQKNQKNENAEEDEKNNIFFQ